MEILENDASLSTRDKILQYLLLSRSDSSGGRTIKEIALAHELSVNAARQYLVILEKEGFVSQKERKGETGRPARVYYLTEDAIEVFPKVYKDFSLSLISQIKKELGVKTAKKILEGVGKGLAKELKEEMRHDLEGCKDTDPLKHRLECIVKIYKKYGKYPELIEDENSFGLKNYNCLVYGLTKEDPIVCLVDEVMVSELAGSKAIKEKCIRDGDECCLYRIQKPKKSNENS